MARRIFNDIFASGGSRTDPGGVKTALGWIAEKPPYQFFNWLMHRADDMIQHLERTGIAIWDVATPYEINGLCRGSDGFIYQAVAASTGVNPVGTVVAPSYATGSWKRFNPPATTGAVGMAELATDGETQALSDTGRVVTPSNLGALAASVSQRGIVELATGAETAALSDGTRGVTPSGLASVIATETARGLVELATPAEVLAGTDTTRAVTPQALGALNQLLANPGFKKFPGGLILQWGSNEVDNTDDFDVVLPTPFLVSHFVSVCGGQTTGSRDLPEHGAAPHPTTPLTHVRLSAGYNNVIVNWLCIGV